MAPPTNGASPLRNLPADRVLEIERVFKAPRALVFKLWSAPEYITRWWGPKGFHLSHCDMDFREGGAWRFCMMPESGKGHWVHGEYREIQPPHRLAFTYIAGEVKRWTAFVEEKGLKK